MRGLVGVGHALDSQQLPQGYGGCRTVVKGWRNTGNSKRSSSGRQQAQYGEAAGEAGR